MTSGQESEDKTDTCQPDTPGSTTIRAITFSGRWLFTLAVIGTAIISIYLFVVGFIVVFSSIITSLAAPQFDMHTLNELLAIFMKIIDIFLVATVFYIIALGFFELFIAKAPLPGWLKICNLDDLKDKLLGLVVIALAVVLLGEALTWDGNADILSFGIAVAAGIAAISTYFWVKR
ncbi:MAG: YqhA family protein [Methanoregulaceae archaeon]|nr:YqhA family protein [Methanoregulaceae archaeon]